MSTRPITVKPTTDQTIRYSIVIDRRVDYTGRKVKPYLHVQDDGIITLRQARRMRSIAQGVHGPKAVVRILRVRQTTVSEVVQ